MIDSLQRPRHLLPAGAYALHALLLQQFLLLQFLVVCSVKGSAPWRGYSRCSASSAAP